MDLTIVWELVDVYYVTSKIMTIKTDLLTFFSKRFSWTHINYSHIGSLPVAKSYVHNT